MTKHRTSIIGVVRAFAYSEPFEDSPIREHYRVVCLFLRYERREISWATFLLESGKYTDAVSGELHCEEFYVLLNDLEESEYNEALETQQAKTIREQFRQHISEVRADYGQLFKT